MATLTIKAHFRSAEEWHAEVTDPASPFAGLHTTGESLAAAADALAQAVYGDLNDPDSAFVLRCLRKEGIDAIEVVATHSHTFRLVEAPAEGAGS